MQSAYVRRGRVVDGGLPAAYVCEVEKIYSFTVRSCVC